MPSDRPPFPREIEAEARVAEALRARLAAAEQPLWAGAAIAAPRMSMGPALADRLGRAARADALVLGLEAAAARLDREAHGLAAADARRGEARGARVSRLLLVADDGAERFYREVERVARRHGARLLVCRLALDAAALGAAVTGRGSRVKAVLVEDKHVVADLLGALAREAEPAGQGGA